MTIAEYFIISDVQIKGLWNSYNLSFNANKKINIFIGANGSGKTTLINLIHNALNVDVEALNEINFRQVKITLKKGNIQKTIKVDKHDKYNYSYKIGNSKPTNIDFATIYRKGVPGRMHRQTLNELIENIKKTIDITSVKIISVHRKLDKNSLEEYNDELYHYNRYRSDAEPINFIDFKIKYLLRKFSEYRESLNAKTDEISQEFRRNVLRALLKSPKENSNYLSYQYNKDDLVDTLKNFGLTNKNDSKLATDFVNSYDQFVEKMKANQGIEFNFLMQMPAYNVLNTAIELSKKSDNAKMEINKPVTQFVNVVNEFFVQSLFEKKISISEGRLKIENNKMQEVDIDKLSSGEKQLIILLLETLLQRNTPQIYIIDEPELSLHIAWQRELIEGITKLNSNIQLFIATHSPEVVSKYSNKVINMEDIIH